MFGAFGRARTATSVTFVSRAALQCDLRARLGVQKALLAVQGTRDVTKASMIHNSAMPNVEVNPETYEVFVDGSIITCAPATVLPMAQRYFLY
jgi:urease subunit alpha